MTESAELEVYVTRDGIAWVRDAAQRGSFTSLLLRHAGMDRASLSAAVADAPKLSSLVGAAAGTISPDALRAALLEHNANLLGAVLMGASPTGLRVHGTIATGQVFAFSLAELRDAHRRLDAVSTLHRSGTFERGQEVHATPRVRKTQSTGNMLAAPKQAKPEHRVGSAAVQTSLRCLSETDGFCGAAIARIDNHVVLGSIAAQPDVPLIAALDGIAESLAASQAHADMQPSGDRVDEMVFTTSDRHFLVRRVRHSDALFILLVVKRSHATLGMANHALREAEAALATR